MRYPRMVARLLAKLHDELGVDIDANPWIQALIVELIETVGFHPRKTYNICHDVIVNTTCAEDDGMPCKGCGLSGMCMC